jgi:hypothetical protein
MSLFCDTGMAERIERVETQLVALGGTRPAPARRSPDS